MRPGWRLATCLWAASLGACINRWEVQEGPLPMAVAASHSRLKVTRRDGQSMVLDDVTLTADTLVGTSVATAPWPASSSRVAIPVGQIATVSRQEPDVVPSIVLGTIAGVALFIGIVSEH